MTAGRLAISTVVGFTLIVAAKVLALSDVAGIWPPLIEVANVVVAALLVLATLKMFSSTSTFAAELLRDLESLGSLFIRVVKMASSPTSRVRSTLRPSVSGWLVSAAVQRLPAVMGEQEKGRWEEEMRADVASVPRGRRLLVAFRIWRKGAPGMPTGSEYAPRSSD